MLHSDSEVANHPVDRWRTVALQFYGVKRCLDIGALPTNFEPADLAKLRKRQNSGALRGVFSFLLHIYHSANRFDLGEVQRWDANHRQAFTQWVTGLATGDPCHYL